MLKAVTIQVQMSTDHNSKVTDSAMLESLTLHIPNSA